MPQCRGGAAFRVGAARSSITAFSIMRSIEGDSLNDQLAVLAARGLDEDRTSE